MDYCACECQEAFYSSSAQGGRQVKARSIKKKKKAPPRHPGQNVRLRNCSRDGSRDIKRALFVLTSLGMKRNRERMVKLGRGMAEMEEHLCVYTMYIQC